MYMYVQCICTCTSFLCAILPACRALLSSLFFFSFSTSRTQFDLRPVVGGATVQHNSHVIVCSIHMAVEMNLCYMHVCVYILVYIQCRLFVRTCIYSAYMYKYVQVGAYAHTHGGATCIIYVYSYLETTCIWCKLKSMNHNSLGCEQPYIT